MKTTYLVWKDRDCNGVNPDWQEITGQEFYALVNAPENKGRRFIKLYSAIEDGSDGDIVMESTKEEYRKWRKEKDHSDWVREGQEEIGYQVVSYHAMETEDGCFGEELLRDENCDVEAECAKTFEREAVRAAIARLSEEEKRMVEYFYLSAEQGTERDYALLHGIPKTTVNRKKMAALEKLKNFLSE
jgi:hypothetical protein